MALTREERERFLAEPQAAAPAVALGEEGRAPLGVPIRYQYAPGGDLPVMTERHSRKRELIARAGRFILLADRFILLVDRLEPTVR